MKPLDPDIYQKIPVTDLILFSAFSLKKEKLDFEDLAKECFDVFPAVFSFEKYDFWPDSRKLDRPLRILREKEFIEGDPATFFKLTEKGERVARDLTQKFTQGKLFGL